MLEFVHPKLNTEIHAIGGHYVFIKEERLGYASDQILYHVGYAVIDSSCCGTGGAAYAQVAGYVRHWHCGTSENQQPLSLIEPIENKTDQNNIRQLIITREGVPQVNFF